MFTGWVTTMFTLQLNVYTVAISSVKKIVINEWLRLNNSGFLTAAVALPIADTREVLMERANVAALKLQGILKAKKA